MLLNLVLYASHFTFLENNSQLFEMNSVEINKKEELLPKYIIKVNISCG
jgi:hypothetical protein